MCLDRLDHLLVVKKTYTLLVFHLSLSQIAVKSCKNWSRTEVILSLIAPRNFLEFFHTGFVLSACYTTIKDIFWNQNSKIFNPDFFQREKYFEKNIPL